MNKEYRNNIRIQVVLTIAVGALLWALSVSLYVLKFNERFIHKECDDFSSYKEIKDAFLSGYTYLDGDGNGIPCESLLRKK